MIFTIFRPKRMRGGKVALSRMYRGRYRLDGETKITDIPLNTTDKQVARQKLEQIVKQRQLEIAGIVPKKEAQEAAQLSLTAHLNDHVDDLTTIGRDDQYVDELKKRVLRLMSECGWEYPKDITPDSFQAWRVKQTSAPKTLNDYLFSASGLLNWMERHERIASNPLRKVQKIQANGKQAKPRRAYSAEEMARLLRVAGPRKVVYLMAVFTGLRRGELKALKWDDLHLDAERPFVNVRASTTKNHKQAVIVLHGDVVAELRALKPAKVDPSALVFENLLPKMSQVKADLKAAKIDYIDSKGKRADFHSMRYTLATALAQAGTAPRVAMEIMRHSSLALTSKIYTDAGLLPTSDAVLSLPSFEAKSQASASQKPDATGQSQSLADFKNASANDSQPAVNTGFRPDEARPGSQMLANGAHSRMQSWNALVLATVSPVSSASLQQLSSADESLTEDLALCH